MEQIFYMYKEVGSERGFVVKPYSLEFNTAAKQYAYCTHCGEKLNPIIEDSRKFSSYTGNKIYVLYLCCPNYDGHSTHVKHHLFDVFRCKHDGLLYTGDFFSPEDGALKIRERNQYGK